MKFTPLNKSVAVFAAAMIIAIGCNRSTESGNNNTPSTAQCPQNVPEQKTAAAANAPQSESANPSHMTQNLVGSEEPKLEPLTFVTPDKDGHTPKPLPINPPNAFDISRDAKPADIANADAMPTQSAPRATMPLQTNNTTTGANSLHNAPANDTQLSPLHNTSSNDLLANPLRGKARLSPAANPIRAAAPDRSITDQSLAVSPNTQQPLRPLPAATSPPLRPAQRPLASGPLADTLPESSPTKTLPDTAPADLSTAITRPSTDLVPDETHSSHAKTSKKSASTFDPVKENGPIFVGWSKPKLALVITGREDGYLEPCGCAGLDRMKGGLSRRHTMIEELRRKGWPLVCIDVGGLSKGYGVQAELKFQITVDAMKKMGYQAVGFSPNDLQLPVDSLVAVAADSGDNPSPFISANVGLLGLDADITSRWRVVEAGGKKIGITSILGKQYAQGLAGDDIEIIDPEKALAEVVPELKKRCDLMILLAHATVKESVALSKKFPDFVMVVTAGGPPIPPAKPTIIKDTNAVLIEVGEKGMDAIVLGLYADAQQPYRYQRVPLDSRFAASQDMKNLMIAYQDRLRCLGLEGLAIKPVTHPNHEMGGEFVGSRACESCHEESYHVWKRSGHARAWATLLETDPPRDADPECISCHVTGWHPTKHFPYTSGFLSEKQTPKMLNVGCESCHGPGESHVEAELGGDRQLQERMLKTVRVTKEEAKKSAEKACQNCHDLDNSPDFNFDTYWPKVEHSESE